MLYHYTYSSPLGNLLFSCNDSALCKLTILANNIPNVNFSNNYNLPIYLQTVRWLNSYFAGNMPNFTPEISLNGTPFQKNVWNELLKIPYNHTLTYGELAKLVNCNSAQAVGQAVSKNQIHLIVPCHRIVAKKSLGGFAAGIDKKVWLLNHENTSTTQKVVSL